MSMLWTLATVTVGPAVLAFVFNTILPEVAKKIAERMAGPLSDRFIEWFTVRFPRAGAFLFRKNPQPVPEASVPQSQEPVWYYADGKERRGPVTPAELRRLYSAGQLTSLSMAWREGMPTWATLASVEDELPAPPKVKIELPKQFAVGPGGVFLGLFLLFFILLIIAVVGVNFLWR